LEEYGGNIHKAYLLVLENRIFGEARVISAVIGCVSLCFFSLALLCFGRLGLL
jgi:hypothetical protein